MTTFTQTLRPGDTLTITVAPTVSGGPAPLPVGVHLTLAVHTTQAHTNKISAYLLAQQAQITEDFCPAWGGSATIDRTPGGWLVELHDRNDTGQAGVLGYHDVDAQGTPYAKVFLTDAAHYGVPWQSVASHEVLELLADANAATTDPGPDGCAWYQEVGDPVEDRSYEKQGVPLSDFALPAWWVAGSPGPWDYLQVLPGPFTVTAGGYADEVCNGVLGHAIQGVENHERSVDRAYG